MPLYTQYVGNIPGDQLSNEIHDLGDRHNELVDKGDELRRQLDVLERQLAARDEEIDELKRWARDIESRLP